jgi:hypothetical protein
MRLLSEMSNVAPSDNIVLRHAVEQIQRALPAHWMTSVATKTNDIADARLTIKTPAGATAALAIGARRQLDPRLVAEVAGALRGAAADGFVVIAPFLGARTRERLAEEGLGFVDLCGNMRLLLDRPTVFISSRGDERSPWAVPRSARSLHAPKACRIVRALADGAPATNMGPWEGPIPPATGTARQSPAAPMRLGVRQLAAIAGTDPGYVSRLLDLFHREELIEREPRGPIAAVHLGRLVRRWAEDYRFGEAHRFVPVAHPHGVPGALARLRDAGAPHALTARAGAAALSGTALPGLVAAYVDNPERVAAIIGAEPVESGANLLLIDPFDPFVFDGTWEASGLRYATRAQIIADLLGSPAPAPGQAAALLEDIEMGTLEGCPNPPATSSARQSRAALDAKAALAANTPASAV